MMPLEERLRAAIRETADEIPADPPPLRLNRPGSHAMSPGGRAGRPRGHAWRVWAAPLAAAAVVFAVVAASLALTGGAATKPGLVRPQTAQAGVPPYYVALVTGHGAPGTPGASGVAAQVRATGTGAVLATIVPPKPYVAFTGVTSAADDRTFVLAAQAAGWKSGQLTAKQVRELLDGYAPAGRLYLLHIDPASSTAGGRVSLQALPASFIPANAYVMDMALSPDGTRLAANIGNQNGRLGTPLEVFDLTTGTKRVWSDRYCANCAPGGGGFYVADMNIDPLSWAADSRHLAFVGPARVSTDRGSVRLLDTNTPGGSLIGDSTPVAGPSVNMSPGDGTNWRGALITPDEQTVVADLEISSKNEMSVRQELVTISSATGKVTAILNSPKIGVDYEQILYTSTTGRELVVSYARPGNSAGILRDGTYTPIPWNTQTIVAAW
jgi:hypothetical protein